MKRTKHGFTLVELIIVIAVIGVLAAILIPTFANVIDKANAKSALSDARNTVTQYVTEAFENKSLPENIVIIIKKAGNYYLYGYNTRGDGSIQKARGGEAYKGLDSVKALFEAYSFNKKHAGQVPDSGRTDYEEATDGSFFLVPYDASGNPTVPVKGFHGTKAAEELPEETTYPTLNDKITDTVGEDVYVYHGVLLGGTYTLDNGNGGSNPTNTPAPTPKQKFTITFKAGNTNGNDAKVTLPNGGSVEVEEGSLFVPGTYSASYAHQASDEEWYVFDGWNPADSFVVTGNAEVTATWVKYTATKYTLTFNANGGSLNLASGVTNGMQIITGTDITSYITGSSATWAEHTFKGWTDGENTYNSSSSGIVITKDITLDAIWEEVKYKMTIDNNNGDAAYVHGSYAIGTNVTLPVAPTKSGYVFDYWKTDNPGDDTQYGSTGTYTMPGRDVTITAVWKDKYTVEYLTYTGVKEDEIKIDADTEITLPSTTSVMRPDEEMEGGVMTYQFTGWICSLGGTYAPGAKYEVVNDVIFQAEFRNVPKFTVSFTAGVLSDNAYVSGIPASFTATPTTNINLGEYGTPVYNYPGTGSDYAFDGWLLNGEKRTTYVMAEETVTFVANWIEKPAYTVKFDANGGSLNLATLSGWTNGGELLSGTDIAALVKGSTATPSGDADFIGWKCGEIVYDPATMPSAGLVVTGNMTFTAQFNTHKYTVKYKAGAGSGSDYTQGEYALNENITLPTASACGFTAPEGMAFDKWQSSINGQSTYGEGASYTVTANVTFTATWTSDSKTVTVKFYDTWNAQTIEGGTINASGNSVNYSEVQSIAPDYWVQGSTTTVSINTDDTVTFSGDRHNTAVSGDAGTDYQVLTTLVGLKKINTSTAYMAKNYWLLNDIDTLGNIGSGENDWTPLGWIGDNDVEFTGKFDGNGQNIRNLVIYQPGGTNVAFMALNSGTIRNLRIPNGSAYGIAFVAAIAGQNLPGGLIDKCYIHMNMRMNANDYVYEDIYSSQPGSYVGGVVGGNRGTIQYCTVDSSYIGRSSSATSMMNGTRGFNGGIAGCNIGTLKNCMVKSCVIGSRYISTVPTTYGRVGGIAGQNSTSSGIIQNCYQLGSGVGAYAQMGGICGWNNGTISKTAFCDYSKGVSASDSSTASRHVGYNLGTLSYVVYVAKNNEAPATGLYGRTDTNCKGTGLQTYLGTTDWSYTSGQYPTLLGVAE